eukprot:GHVT01033586.1.p1 GENE.GHVT01033586.1~~GHVT01033586.1.p1  ORF type:complete len:472 (+),score=104.02 GHVT01033586.1:2313-3728(+)
MGAAHAVDRRPHHFCFHARAFVRSLKMAVGRLLVDGRYKASAQASGRRLAAHACAPQNGYAFSAPPSVSVALWCGRRPGGKHSNRLRQLFGFFIVVSFVVVAAVGAGGGLVPAAAGTAAGELAAAPSPAPVRQGTSSEPSGRRPASEGLEDQDEVRSLRSFNDAAQAGGCRTVVDEPSASFLAETRAGPQRDEKKPDQAAGASDSSTTRRSRTNTTRRRNSKRPRGHAASANSSVGQPSQSKKRLGRKHRRSTAQSAVDVSSSLAAPRASSAKPRKTDLSTKARVRGFQVQSPTGAPTSRRGSLRAAPPLKLFPSRGAAARKSSIDCAGRRPGALASAAASPPANFGRRTARRIGVCLASLLSLSGIVAGVAVLYHPGPAQPPSPPNARRVQLVQRSKNVAADSNEVAAAAANQITAQAERPPRETLCTEACGKQLWKREGNACVRQFVCGCGCVSQAVSTCVCLRAGGLF